MDLVAPNAPIEYALQTIKWCVQNNETRALRAILETNFNENKLSDVSDECTDIFYRCIALVSNAPLEMLLEHVNENFLKQTFGNEKKTLVTKLLCNAVESGQANKIQSLVKNGADVNYSYQGKPLLHLALELGSVDVAKALVDAGASVSILDRRGNGPLVAVIQSTVQNKAEIIRWLIDKGSDPLQPCSSGKLPIHIAANSCRESLGVLIDAGCDVNIKDAIHGETPLHYACNSCCKETIIVLIQTGAAFNLVNRRGETPLHKLLRFAIDFHDFHSKLRKHIAKKLIDIGFRILPLRSSNKNPMRKGRDKIRDLYTTLNTSRVTIPTLQSIARAELREIMSCHSFAKSLELLDMPRHLKSDLLFADLTL